MSAGIGYAAFQLYWNNGSQYAHGSSGHYKTTSYTIKSLKKKKTYYGIFHFSDFQYGWLSYANRRSAASNGIYAWSTSGNVSIPGRGR